MHPGFHGFWKRAHASWNGHDHHHAHCGEETHGCGPRGGGPPPWARGGGGPPWGDEGHRGPPGHGDDGGGFGVRRPLRFLAWKLELEEPQVAELAAVLDELKTERAQAAVDQRRTTAAFADSIAAAEFDAGKAEAAGAERAKSAERVQAAVVSALRRIHALLDEEQRKKLSYLLRTGQLSI